ncbi:hypothetical protein GLOTRDRAFT_92602 [Gloeophyllum trabeum ATCC 11539]|uniref:Uncharacterized protein n=1 Tax=Gloeophyllum trabeum (strain ATCC 11539 / FP-39264 / Madison 617) TaxID=670483 RepID=S7RSI3_GLOTA|nr:uncharacterized protein GLOTRDRAFT_92602 [Gloeophyllum trabeum ATCC 11539]EPQ57620.1 hypothetical protein GLOTRDRAFT_92602 [Gloeophyllum trabeum ATCC 11539]
MLFTSKTLAALAAAAVAGVRAQGAYYCTDINWGGNCQYTPDYGVCVTFGGSDWNDQVSSFGPDQGLECYLYTDWGCTGDVLPLEYPGAADLRQYSFNDAVSSFACEYAGQGTTGSYTKYVTEY